MVENKQMWASDWRDRIAGKIREFGFGNMTELLASMAGKPYGVVAKTFGEGVAPIQVISMQFHEARTNDQEREAAKDCLVRNLVEKLPEGWGVGSKHQWKTTLALSSWCSEVVVTGECESFEPKLKAIAQSLLELPPPNGWIPTGPDDSIVVEVFEKYWC